MTSSPHPAPSLACIALSKVAPAPPVLREAAGPLKLSWTFGMVEDGNRERPGVGTFVLKMGTTMVACTTVKEKL